MNHEVFFTAKYTPNFRLKKESSFSSMGYKKKIHQPQTTGHHQPKASFKSL